MIHFQMQLNKKSLQIFKQSMEKFPPIKDLCACKKRERWDYMGKSWKMMRLEFQI